MTVSLKDGGFDAVAASLLSFSHEAKKKANTSQISVCEKQSDG